ncbi:unnamed protein product, partial [Ixodes persulcatus]
MWHCNHVLGWPSQHQMLGTRAGTWDSTSYSSTPKANAGLDALPWLVVAALARKRCVQGLWFQNSRI